MSPSIVLWILIIGMLAVGIFALRGAIKDSFKNVELKKAKARMLRDILGEQGYRYFVGALGAFFIIASLTMAYLLTFGLNLKKSEDAETNEIVISAATADPTIKSTIYTKESQLNVTYQAVGTLDFDRYQQISFKNNYISKLPDVLWQMKNIESIDLTNNDFTELPIQQLKSMPSLKRVVLDGNPIEPAYLDKIKSELEGIEVVKNDVVK